MSNRKAICGILTSISDMTSMRRAIQGKMETVISSAKSD